MINSIMQIIQRGITSKEDKALISNSLFYYCCGIDPSPIFAFNDKIPLYIYSDIIDYGWGQLRSAVDALNERIQSKGYTLESMQYINDHNALMQWQTWDGKYFYVVYAKGDSEKVFKRLYATMDEGKHNNFIVPKCICNYRHELPYESPVFMRVEKTAPMILGYCDCDKYTRVAQYEYYGDYGAEPLVLFRREYYYLY